MDKGRERDELASMLEGVFSSADRALDAGAPRLEAEEIGRVIEVSKGVTRVSGLPGLCCDELVFFGGAGLGLAFDLHPDLASVVLLTKTEALRPGTAVRRSGRKMDVPVGDRLLGRVIDPLGRSLDGGPSLEGGERLPIEREAPPIMARSPVTAPLQTGIVAVDALIPVGRGQRELIIGDRQIGKTALALSAIENQVDSGILSVYCSIGQQSTATAKVVAELEARGALSRSVVVVASGDDPPGLNFIAPYAAASIAEYFMERGGDSLVVFDDLSRHARSYRELSLLMRRPPAREAYPGDIFYIHSRLLERATHLSPERGGGSMTALPIVETEAQNIAAYIPTNLVSITDGQIYLAPRLFQEGRLPAIDIGVSVSRVGGKAQVAAYAELVGDLRIAYSQFEELEMFERFSSRLDAATRASLERGKRIREVLKQDREDLVDLPSQIALLLAVTEGVFDTVPVEGMRRALGALRAELRGSLGAVSAAIASSGKLEKETREAILACARRVAELGPWNPSKP